MFSYTNQKRMNGYGFTLVELIVVITILVILGTIAFVNLGNFSGSARDSVRISDMKNIETGLSLYQIKSGTYPDPEDSISIEASGTVIGYQGYFGDIASSIIRMSKSPLDPTDKTKYTYAVNVTKTKYQLMAYTEENDTISFQQNLNLINQANAVDYSQRYPKTIGSTIGILVYNTGTIINKPLQENASFTGIDLINYAGTDIKTILTDTESISGTILSKNSTGLVGYWDMESTTMSGAEVLLKDLSPYQNHGTCYNSGSKVNCGTLGTGPQIVEGDGKTGKAMNFDGVDDWISPIGFDPDPYRITIFIKYNTNGFGTGTTKGIIAKRWTSALNDWRISTDYINGQEFLSYTIWNEDGTSIYYKGLNLPIKSSKISTMTIDNNKYNFYYNGSNINKGDLSPVRNSTQNILFGRDGYFMERFYEGLIDEIRIYNRALSDSEISALYNATK